MTSPRPKNKNIDALRNALLAATAVATDRAATGPAGEAARKDIAEKFNAVKNSSTPEVKEAIVDLQSALNSSTWDIERIGSGFVKFVNVLPADVHRAVRTEIEGLSDVMNVKKFANISNLPDAPQPASPPAPPLAQSSPNPPSPDKTKEEIEKERRQKEEEQNKNLQIAKANWAGRNVRVKFNKDDAFKIDEAAIESGVEWKTDVKIEPGIYRIESPNKEQESFWLEVKNDGSITANSAESTGYAMDFFMTKGALDLTIDFKKPGPGSFEAVLNMLDQAEKRPGVKVEIGPGLKHYMTSDPKDLKNLDFRFPGVAKKIQKRIDSDPEVKAGFAQWLADKKLTGKNLNKLSMAGMQLEYLMNHHNQKAEKEREFGLPSFVEVANYKGRVKLLEDTQKLAAKDGSPSHQTQMFGEKFDDKPTSEKLNVLDKEMSSIQERMASLNKELDKLNNGMKAEIDGRLSKPDEKLLAHVNVVNSDRNELIEQVSRERKDLADRLGVCTKEIDGLKAAGIAPDSDDGKKLAALQANSGKQGDAAIKMEDGVRQAQQAAELLKPEEVIVRIKAEKKVEGQRLAP